MNKMLLIFCSLGLLGGLTFAQEIANGVLTPQTVEQVNGTATTPAPGGGGGGGGPSTDTLQDVMLRGNTTTVSMAIGINNVVNTNGAFAQGLQVGAYGDYSHAEGVMTYTTAPATGAHVEGQGSAASGVASHAEGFNSSAGGTASHAEGSAMALGTASHAEGANGEAMGLYSHSEGLYCFATGDISHSDGSNTCASGYACHSSGANSWASNKFSYVWSDGTHYGSNGTNTFNVCATGGIWDNTNKISQNGTLYSKGVPVLTSTAPIYGYLNGCWPTYVNGTNVYLNIGDGYSSNQYFIAGTQYVAVSTWSPAAWGYQYFYVNYAASTFPNGPVFYASTNQPMFATNLNQWVCTNTAGDRLVGAAIQSNQVVSLDCTSQVVVPASWDSYRVPMSGVYTANGTLNGHTKYHNAARSLYIYYWNIGGGGWALQDDGDTVTYMWQYMINANPALQDWGYSLDGNTLAGHAIAPSGGISPNQTILPFAQSASGFTKFKYLQVSGWDPSFVGQGMLLVSEGNPDGTWQTVPSVSTYLPVGAQQVQMAWIQYGPGCIALADADDAAQVGQDMSTVAYWPSGAGSIWGGGAGIIGSGYTFDIGPSRSVKWWGPDAGQNYANIWIQGYRCSR